MKLKLIATGFAPDYYEIAGDVITAHVGAESDSYDLSPLPEGATLTEVSPVGGVAPIRAATRIGGELHVTLLQRVIAGQYPGRKAHWRGLTTIDAGEYDPTVCYVTPTGMAGVDDYEIVWGVGLGGEQGWTVRKIREVVNG